MKRHKPVVVANWKMNVPEGGVSEYVARCASVASVRQSRAVEVWIAPPFPYLSSLRAEISAFGLDASIGAQNCSDEQTGALTGEVSALMVADQAAIFVILGHSERRTKFGETSELVSRKITAVRRAGLVPLVCIGEDLESHERGSTAEVLTRQLHESIGPSGEGFGPLVVAYEPIWAIGTGQNATPDVVATANELIRGVLSELGEGSTRVLYGGSVTPENAAALALEGDADGFLVGGASLDPSKFMAICSAVSTSAAPAAEKS